MTNNLEDELQRIVARMDNQESQDNPQTPQEEIQDIYVLIVREQEEDQSNVVESTSTPVIRQQDSFISAYLFVCFSLFLILSTLTFQLYSMFNPPIATITIIPKSQTVTLSGTVQLGRVLPPLTISQSLTTPATGKGHQIAKAATGYITFYNGQFQSVTITAGTILTGASGIQIVTDQDATIPARNPPSYGQVTVSAHAINAGVSGNIPAYDINQVCCETSVLAKNINSFYGGQDERNYQTVAMKDIVTISTPLKTAVTQSMHGALQGQLQQGEALQLIPCTPTVTSDHPIGAEATQVKVTVSQSCSAVVYNSQELETKATAYLQTQAQHKTGAGYSLFGTVQIHVTQAIISSTTPHLVFLSFHATGTWIYGISPAAQQQIKHLIAGKTTHDAQTLLASMPGVEQASIRLSGFGDNTRLPKNNGYMHLTIFIV